MPSISRARALAYATVALFALVVGARLLERGDPAPTGGSKAVAIEAEEPVARQVTVHVVGAVANPGLYQLDEGSRIDDAIRKAGGATPKAELALVNLASPVADGQQVLVPKEGEVAVAGSGPGAEAGTGQRVHLNSATLEQLDSLPGVGPVTAQGILDYRTEHGAFQSVDELDAVPGIGPARLERLTELVDL